MKMTSTNSKPNHDVNEALPSELRARRTQRMRLAAHPLLASVACAALLWSPNAHAVSPPVSPAPEKPVVATVTKPAGLKWHPSTQAGYAESIRANRPLLVVIGEAGCPPCAALEKELENPEAAAALARWTLVRLDADQSPGASAMLQSGTLPVVRLLTPSGRRVDVKEGVLKADEVVRWLEEKHAEATATAGDELLAATAPDSAAVARLVKHLSSAEAGLREAAIRRLLAHPKETAGAMVEILTKGDLATRLSALEVLGAWKAPIDGMDPWLPETISNERIAKLVAWSGSGAAAVVKAATQPAATAPVALTPAERMAMRRALDAMIAASTEEEARAGRERLVRDSRGLADEVRERLRGELNPAARERLMAMRYRLVATDNLALTWPGGIERLASSQTPARRAAADELVARAAAGDAPLLLEMFSDPDAMVREISLRGLRAAGKGDAARTLVGLLADPDLNVRAAVLKQLSESPTPALVEAVVKFVATEPDVDLVVHGIRVLRHSKLPQGLTGLMAMLSHANWRVRAEAADALSEMAGRGGNLPDERKADIYIAMLKLLDDPDGFVVSRVVTALSGADLAVAVEPMANAAAKHPEIAGELIRAIANGSNTKPAAEKHLRTLCSHADPGVRAPAITALLSVSNECQKEASAALKDPVLKVRMAAARAVFGVINRLRPGDDDEFSGVVIDGRTRPAKQEVDAWQWVADFRIGKGRPSWLNAIVLDLEALMGEADPEAKLDGALALLPLGPDESKPLEVIRSIARTQKQLITRAAEGLPWLPSARRVEFFKYLISIAPATELDEILEQMSKITDSASAEAIWELASKPTATSETESTVYGSLIKAYLGARYYRSDLPESVRKKIVEGTKPRLATGNEAQKRIALALLLKTSLSDAATAAKAIRADGGASAKLKASALQIALLASPKSEGTALATQALSAPPAKPGMAGDALSEQLISLRYLTSGGSDLNQLNDSFYLNFDNPELERNMYYNRNQPIKLEPPAKLNLDALRPLLKAGKEESALAGYLLALSGDRSGIEPLIKFWRAQRAGDDRSRRLLYRAITAAAAEDLVPVLEEVYNSYAKDRYELREFYWTIRLLAGEKALLLRKKIRDEVGIGNLT